MREGGERPLKPQALSRLYRDRFTGDDLSFKERGWRLLSERFFQRFVGPDDTVLDVGAGHCEFINAIRCGDKIAVDLNPDVVTFAQDALALVASSTDMEEIGSNTVDVAFTSNFLEHLPSKDDVLRTLEECHRVLRPQGTLIVLMPNIRYLNGRYWDYFDHHIPLTHHSLVEALTLSGFTPTSVIPRFLPYTVKQRALPRSLLLLRIYLRARFLWPLFGRQMLVLATRT